MNSQIVRRAPRDREELSAKLQELVRLRAQLVDRELFLTNLRSEIHAFEIRYMREVGALYHKLDEWNAKIAKAHAEDLYIESAKIQQELSELLSGIRTGPVSDGPSSWRGRFRSRQNAGAFRIEDDLREPPLFQASKDLKAAYREVAKRVHPDFAIDEHDRKKREALMKEANSAYQRGDLEMLRRILEEYETNPDLISGTGDASNLETVMRQITRVRSRLKQIEQEITALLASDIGNLKLQADAESARGDDLLTEMAHEVQKRIDAARERFYSGLQDQP